LLARLNALMEGFRISCDGVEIGSISKANHSVSDPAYLLLGVAITPFTSHGAPPPTPERDCRTDVMDAGWRRATSLRCKHGGLTYNPDAEKT
jgi:hypothetical protein